MNNFIKLIESHSLYINKYRRGSHDFLLNMSAIRRFRSNRYLGHLSKLSRASNLINEVLVSGDGSLVLALLCIQSVLELLLEPVAEVGRELPLVLQSLLQDRNGSVSLLHRVLEADELLSKLGGRLAGQIDEPEV